MKKLFLYRLYHHSRIAFLLSVIFIVVYAVLFIKKIDMVLFPYNNMFSLSSNQNMTAITHGVKINNNPVVYTHYSYWKKDLLETSVAKYALYQEKNKKVFLGEYLYEKQWSNATKLFLEKHLTPQSADSWPVWYCNFAGYNIQTNDIIEIYRYKLDFNTSYTRIIDSSLVYKTIAP